MTNAASVAAYYRLGDLAGTYQVQDSSGNGQTGSLISGSSGTPALGYAGPMLYDPSTALDLTNGANVLNGGFATIDQSTQPPTQHQPLGGASSWTFECWAKWTSNTSTTPGEVTTFTGTIEASAITNVSVSTGIAVGDAITGTDIPAGTVVVSWHWPNILISQPSQAGGANNGTFYVTGGAVGSTLFSASSVAALGTSGIDVRVGAATGVNVTPGTATTFTGTIEASVISNISPSFTGIAAGYGIYGTDVATGTVILSANFPNVVISQPSQAGGANNGTFVAIAPSTAISASVSAASVSGNYNRISFGTVAAGTGAYTIDGYSSGTVNVQDNNWHHIAIPYSGSVASIFIDGLFDSSWAVGTNWTHPQSISIGCDDGPINGWAGAMSDVALYSTPLNGAQIANHYATGAWFQQQEIGAANGAASVGRLNKLMAVEGLNSSQMLNVPYPFRTLMYSETNSVTTTSGLNYLQTMSETEPGLIFQGPNGQINAYNRQYQYLNPTSVTSQGVFGDSNAASVQFHYDGPSFALVQDDLDVWNNVQVQSGRSGSQLQQSISPSSASVYGSRTLQGLTSLQFENDSDALAVAENYLQWYANPVKRVVGISINSWGNNGNNIPQMLQRGLYDRITIQYQGQTPGPQFSQDSLIESISHSVSMTGGGTWATTYQMSPYEILLTPFIFGASVGSASNQLAGAASVTGSGTAWVLHNPPVNDFYSGTITFTVASGATTTVAYNSTAAQCQTALAALVPSTTVSGGPLNTTNINITFGSSQGSFSAYFSPSNSLTL